MATLTANTFFTAIVSGTERVVATYEAGEPEPVSPTWPASASRRYTSSDVHAVIGDEPPEGSALVATRLPCA